MLCSATAAAMIRETLLICSITLLMSSMEATAWAAIPDGLDPLADIVGGRGRLLGQLLDLGRHHGEALAGLAGPGGFDRCVQRQEIGLFGDVLNHLGHFADFFGGRAQLTDCRLLLAASWAACATPAAWSALGPRR